MDGWLDRWTNGWMDGRKREGERDERKMVSVIDGWMVV